MPAPNVVKSGKSTIAARTVSAPRADGVTRSNGLHA